MGKLVVTQIRGPRPELPMTRSEFIEKLAERYPKMEDLCRAQVQSGCPALQNDEETQEAINNFCYTLVTGLNTDAVALVEGPKMMTWYAQILSKKINPTQCAKIQAEATTIAVLSALLAGMKSTASSMVKTTERISPWVWATSALTVLAFFAYKPAVAPALLLLGTTVLATKEDASVMSSEIL